MTDRGTSIADASLACPFVAFEDDRDARSDQPDHRHRCYAEVRPAPRATAHQERYCLTAAFGSCPTFQDWARREAARVRWPSARPSSSPTSAAPAAHGEAAPGEVGPGEGATQRAPAAPGEGATQRAPAAPGEGAGQRAPATPGEGATPSETPAAAAGLAASRFLRPEDLGEEATPSRDRRSWAAPPPWSPESEPRTPTEPETPAFLSERTMRDAASEGESGRTELLPAVPEWEEPPVAPPPRRRHRERIDVDAPSWEEPRRFEAYPTIKTRIGMPSLSRPLLGLLVLVAAAAALFLLPPYLLDIGGGSSAVASPSPSPSVTPSPSPSPEPSPTPLVYVVKKGDTLTKIANAHGVTLEALIAANNLSDPDKIKVGQELVIPTTPTEASAEPASEEPSPSPSP